MENTVVAITGASSGIGEAFARKLAAGHDLILIARRKERLERIASNLFDIYGTRAEILQADLTDDADLERVSERIGREQRLALLINNAGFGIRGRFWEVDLAENSRMHKLHITATLRLTHSALRSMVARDFGGIINVASISSFLRSPGTTSYSATKAWMSAFTEGLYLELREARSQVAVQALCPGFTYSEFHEAMGMARPKVQPWLWLTAEEVVEASLDGLRRRKPIVIPGWRYKLITAVLTRLPYSAKLAIEAVGGKTQQPATPILAENRKQLSNGN